MDKIRAAKIIRQVKLDRAARRIVELEIRPARVFSHVFMTSKKDFASKIQNTVTRREYE